MVPCLNHAIVVWFVPNCYPDSASSAHLQSFDGLRMHPYGHPLHHKMLKHFIYIQGGSAIKSEVVLGLNYVIVVWFVLSCYPGSARSTHLHDFHEVRMHPYGHTLHQKVLKYFI